MKTPERKKWIALCPARAWDDYRGFSAWIARHHIPLLVGLTLLQLLLILLRFDPKVSPGGDDSFYYLAAYDFWQGTSFPGWHGPLYPILLSPLVGGLHLSVPMVKVLSVLFTIGAGLLLGFTFRRRVEPKAWLLALLAYSTCSQLVVLGSTTYSEPLFLLVQAAVLWLTLNTPTHPQPGKGQSAWGTWGNPLLLGLTIFLLAQTRNVGMGALIAIPLFLLLDNLRWRPACLTLAGFALPAGLFSLYKRQAWGVQAPSFAQQMERMRQVDFYNADQGYENLTGLLVRFWKNCEQYLSKHLLSFMGFNPEEPSTTITIVLLALALVVLFTTARRQRTLLLLTLYLALMLGVTFITQQVKWNQHRLILVYLPLLVLFFSDGLLKLKGPWGPAWLHKTIRIATVLLLFVTPMGNLSANLSQLDPKGLRANLRGDTFHGLTPDWHSYLKVSEWAGAHLPEEAVIACRKPYNSRVYAHGRPFQGIFRLLGSTSQEVTHWLDSVGVDYIIAGRLRINPAAREELFINTVHNSLIPVLNERPDYLALVYASGSSEPAYLFQIHRENPQVMPTIDENFYKRIRAGLLVYPDNPNAIYWLNQQSLEQEKPQEVLDALTNIYALYRQHKFPIPTILLEQEAAARIMLGQFPTAIDLIEKQLTVEPSAQLFYLLSQAYHFTGQPAKAQHYLKLAQQAKEEGL